MKRFIMVTFACVPALLATACSGNGGDQGQATMKEVTTVVNEADVKPVTSDVFSSLKVSGQPCSLDSIDGDYASKLGLIKGETHVFRGWLANHVRVAAGKFELVLSSGERNFGIPVSTGTPRPDVAKGLHAPALASAGFNFSTTLSAIPPGDYQVRFLLAEEGGVAYWCDAKKTIDIR